MTRLTPLLLCLTLFLLVACDDPVAGPGVQVASGTDLPPKPDTAPSASRNAFGGGNRTMERAFVDVLQQLEPVAERECRQASVRRNCDFVIVVDDTPGMPPNAFYTVDETGRPIIAFTYALIADAQNRDELAFVMAHEAAHHIERHIERRFQIASRGAEVFGELARRMGGDTDAVRTAQEIGAATGALSYSKEFELEADRLGAIIAYKAGFDPLLGAQYFFRIPDPGNAFLSTHPANAERFAAVQEVAGRL